MAYNRSTLQNNSQDSNRYELALWAQGDLQDLSRWGSMFYYGLIVSILLAPLR